MLYRHVFDKISTEFQGILRAFVNFVDLPEFHGFATVQNITSPELHHLRYANWARLFKGRLALKLRLNLTRVSFSCVQKHFLG